MKRDCARATSIDRWTAGANPIALAIVHRPPNRRGSSSIAEPTTMPLASKVATKTRVSPPSRNRHSQDDCCLQRIPLGARRSTEHHQNFELLHSRRDPSEIVTRKQVFSPLILVFGIDLDQQRVRTFGTERIDQPLPPAMSRTALGSPKSLRTSCSVDFPSVRRANRRSS